MKIVERASFHAGKWQSKSGQAFEPDHNTNEKGRARQEHIDPSKFKDNIYWYRDSETDKVIAVKGGSGGFSSKKVERAFAKKHFQEGLDHINERYRKSRHSENCKTMTEYLKSKPPMEIITELGSVKSQIPLAVRSQILTEATVRTFAHLDQKFSENLALMNLAFHADEGRINGISLSNHMHARLMFFAEGRDQMKSDPSRKCLVLNQNEALKQMGFNVPKYTKGMTKEQIAEAVRNPKNWGENARKTELYQMALDNPEIIKHSKICNATVAFTDYARELFNLQLERAGRSHGISLTIERQANNRSYRQLIKKGEIDLSKDVLTSLDRPKTVLEFKADREEQRAKEALAIQEKAARATQEAQKAARAAQDAQKAAEMEKDKVQVSLEKIRSEAAQKSLELAEKERKLTFSAGELAAAENQVTETKKEIAELRKEKSTLQLEVERLKAKMSVWAKKLDERLKKTVEKTGIFRKRDTDTVTVSLKAWQDVRTEVDQIERVLEKEPYVSQEIDEAKRQIAGVEKRARQLQEEQEEIERERGQLARERLQFDSQVKKRAEKLAEKFLRENNPREWSISELRQELQAANLENRQLRQKLYEITHQRTVDHDRLRD